VIALAPIRCPTISPSEAVAFVVLDLLLKVE